jgi:hypothetical protein
MYSEVVKLECSSFFYAKEKHLFFLNYYLGRVIVLLNNNRIFVNNAQ